MNDHSEAQSRLSNKVFSWFREVVLGIVRAKKNLPVTVQATAWRIGEWPFGICAPAHFTSKPFDGEAVNVAHYIPDENGIIRSNGDTRRQVFEWHVRKNFELYLILKSRMQLFNCT